jgi:aspartate/methionine/tyrosine aminotransferase
VKLLTKITAPIPVEGYLELKEAICRKFKRDNDLEYKPSQIVVSTEQNNRFITLHKSCLNDDEFYQHRIGFRISKS